MISVIPLHARYLARHLAFGHVIAFSDLDDIICALQIKKLMLREVEYLV